MPSRLSVVVPFRFPAQSGLPSRAADVSTGLDALRLRGATLVTLRSLSRKRKDVSLRPLDRPELIELVAGWLARKENYQWLDFRDGAQALTPMWLKILTQRKQTILRVYTSDEFDPPIGVVALDDGEPILPTARPLGVAGSNSIA